MQVKVYNQKGKETGSIALPDAVFGAPKNENLLHQVAVSMQSNMRAGTAHTKDRSDVAGGGRKPWRQKGTGRARHGSIRSPIWKGGGVTHGPRSEKDYGKKINKKMRAKALYTALSQKLRDGEIFFIDSISLSEPKTKLALNVLADLSNIPGAKEVGSRRKNTLYLALGEKNENTSRGFRNFGNVEIGGVRNLNVLDVLNNKYVIIANPEESVKTLEARIK